MKIVNYGLQKVVITIDTCSGAVVSERTTIVILAEPRRLGEVRKACISSK